MTRRLGIVLAALMLCSAPVLAADGPRLVIEPESFDFGEALPQHTLAKDFRFSNQGDEDLVIQKVVTTCGCTVVGEYDQVVKPGDATIVRISLSTRDDRGQVRRQVLVRSNDARGRPQKIDLVVTVVAPEESSEE